MSGMKTKGSSSFVNVSLEELNRVLQPHATIVVKKSFAKELGFATKEPDVTLSDKAIVKPDFQSVDLD
jgi:hypothetical protein